MTRKKPSGVVEKQVATRGEAVRPETAAEKKTPTEAERQLDAWEAAMRAFAQQRFEEACENFRRAAAGPASHIADKARSYMQICERKTARPQLQFSSAEDHFNYGVERLNSGDTEQARFHFDRALSINPDGDHILYTLALCCGISGDGEGACENLKRAIGLDPRNRILARQDPEFSPLFGQFPALRALLASD
jgi:tetratricopeptide (TPR) repeat protein